MDCIAMRKIAPIAAIMAGFALLLIQVSTDAAAEPYGRYEYDDPGWARCPPGYDGYSGHCEPNRNRGEPSYGHRRRHRYYPGYAPGTPCPPGYDGSTGR